MSQDESPRPPRQSSTTDTPSVSPSVAEFARRKSTLTDISRNTLEVRARDSRVWVPDTTGKYVKHRSRTGLTEDENKCLSPTSLDYDPYRNRYFKSSIGNCVALLHLLKGNIGNGIWEMPSGFRIAGLVTGTIGTVIIAAIFSYSYNLLMKTEYLLCKRKRVPNLSYGDAMCYAMEEGPDWMIRYSKQFRTFTNVALVLYQIGTLVVYMTSASKAVKGVLDEFHCDVLSLQAMMSALGIIFLLILCVPDLRTFGYFTAVALTLSMTCLSMVSYKVFTEVRVHEVKPSLIGTPKVWNKFVDILMFAITSPGLVYSTERHMARPQDFVGVFGIVNLSMVISALLYMYIGISGYSVYLAETKSHIFHNLPKNEVLTRAVFILQSISVIISFGLQAFPLFDVLWNDYLLPMMAYTSTKRQHIYNYTMRAVLFVITYVIAMTISNYIGFILSFTVVVNMSLLGFGFPAIMQICYLWPDNFGKLNWIYYKDLAMIVLATTVIAGGLYNTINGALSPHPPAETCSSTSPSANDTSS